MQGGQQRLALLLQLGAEKLGLLLTALHLRRVRRRRRRRRLTARLVGALEARTPRAVSLPQRRQQLSLAPSGVSDGFDDEAGLTPGPEGAAPGRVVAYAQSAPQRSLLAVAGRARRPRALVPHPQALAQPMLPALGGGSRGGRPRLACAARLVVPVQQRPLHCRHPARPTAPPAPPVGMRIDRSGGRVEARERVQRAQAVPAAEKGLQRGADGKAAGEGHQLCLPRHLRPPRERSGTRASPAERHPEVISHRLGNLARRRRGWQPGGR